MNKTLAFLLGVIVVGGGALLAVYSGMFSTTEPQPVTGIATTPASDAAAPKESAPEKSAAPAEKAPEAAAKAGPSNAGADGGATADSAASESGTAAPADKPETVEAGGKEVVVPSFDVLRVEPSGSLVIAGKAAPDSKVDIIAGATPLGSTKAEPNGDFAAVLDNALAPGDHQLVLRSTAPDGTAATSTETAVVSIPENKDGQVLALVEKPGEPSRLITKPEAVEPAAGSSQASGGAATAPSAPASSTGDSSKEVASGQSAGQTGEGETPAATQPAAKAPAPAAPDKLAAAEQAPSADAAQKNEPAASESSAAPASGGAGQDATPSASSGATVATQPEKTAEQAAPAAAQDEKGNVSVEAVEIDGSHVYVAGQATPGKRVLVYANDVLLGASQVSEAGRFLVDTQHDLPVGDYIIRADLVGPNGMKVVARAAVPFAREAGDRIAAVAPSVNPAAAATPPAGQKTAAPRAEETSPQKAEAAAAQAPAAAQDSTAKTAVEALAAPKEEPAQAASSEPSGAQTAAQAEPETKADTKEASAANSPSVAAPAQPKETLAAPLQEVQGSVIIRRGDTLWTIADRTYGRGVRYTTIYLANKPQIRDPDKIWPGQVFTMPQTSIPDSEALKVHRELH